MMDLCFGVQVGPKGFMGYGPKIREGRGGLSGNSNTGSYSSGSGSSSHS